MNKLKRVENAVKQVLEEVEAARSDDFLLVAEVYYRLVPECINMPFAAVMLGHRSMKLPYFESIRRTRQKLQAKYEELKPSEDKQRKRVEESARYIEYSKEA